MTRPFLFGEAHVLTRPPPDASNSAFVDLLALISSP
jgi:hypothetical protein